MVLTIRWVPLIYVYVSLTPHRLELSVGERTLLGVLTVSINIIVCDDVVGPKAAAFP